MDTNLSLCVLCAQYEMIQRRQQQKTQNERMYEGNEKKYTNNSTIITQLNQRYINWAKQ